jgi:hypothetical protein
VSKFVCIFVILSTYTRCHIFSIENTALLGTKLSVIGHDVGIVPFEGGVRLLRAINHGGGSSSIAGRDSLGVNKMSIAGSSGKNLISGFPLQCSVLVEDIVPVGLGGTEATGDDFVVNTDYSVLCDIL